MRDDPLLNWEPYPKQRQFLESEKREVWFVAANRAGKSDVAAAAGAAHLRFGNPDPRGAYCAGGQIVVYDRAVSALIASPTLEMSRNIMQPKIFNNGYVPAQQPHAPFIPDYELLPGDAGWSEKKRTLRLKNGSLGRFMAYEQGAEAFQGQAAQIAILDEAPPKPIYTEVGIRVEGGAASRLLLRCAMTLLPTEKHFIGGAHWVFTERCTPWLRGERPDNLEMIAASIYENPHIAPAIIADLEAMYPPGSIDRRIRLQGEWLPGMLGAVAYSAFDRQIHMNPQVTPDSRVWRVPLLFCYDSNIEPAVAVVAQELFPRTGGPTIYRALDEIVLESGTVREVAAEFRRRFPAHGAGLEIYGDATATKRNAQTAKSDYEILDEEFRTLPYPVTFHIPKSNPPQRDRINAVNYLLRGPRNQVRTELAGHCTELAEDLETVIRDKYGGIKKAHDKRDPYYRRTHLSDGWGYMVCMREPVSAQIIPERLPPRIPRPQYFGRRR